MALGKLEEVIGYTDYQDKLFKYKEDAIISSIDHLCSNADYTHGESSRQIFKRSVIKNRKEIIELLQMLEETSGNL